MISDKQNAKMFSLAYQGKSFAEIGREMSLKQSTVRMHLIRHGFQRKGKKNTFLKCTVCGKPIAGIHRKHTGAYCSEKCRSVLRRTLGTLKEPTYQHVCKGCGVMFKTIGNKNQKYCSKECYNNYRKGRSRRELLSESSDV